jgi:hypothetical protein
MRFIFAASLVLTGACVDGSDSVRELTDVHTGQRTLIGCPSGDECSDATPNGLRVRSLTFVGEPPFYTATGGSQRFELLWPTGEAFDLPFVAEAVGAEIDLLGSAQTPATITIGGPIAGGNLITLRDPATGELYDQVWFINKPVAEMQAPPLRGSLLIGATMLVPTEVEFTVELHSPDSATGWFEFGPQEYLADELLEVVPDAQLATIATIDALGGHDYRLRINATGPGTLTIRGGDQLFDIPVNGVDQIDDFWPDDPSVRAAVGETTTHCVFGLSNGSFVSGLDYAFTATGAVELQAIEGQCVDFVLTEGQVPATVTASAAGVARTWSVIAQTL